MSYIDKNLITGEEVIKRAKVSWWYALPQLLLGLICMWLVNSLQIPGVGILILLICVLSAVLTIVTTELALTNKRIIAKFGFIERNSVEIRLEKIESINFSQSLLGRIFNFGSINIGGTGGKSAPIPAIANPLEFKRAVNDYLETLKDAK